ncbi:MAG: aminoglycoside phosphotransferase family protein [Clostridia bacterium]|nr:aminoglycoside phosphotransferase family protein [Clostridia bacterium]
MKYLSVLNHYALIGNPVSVELYGEGHINETNCVVTDAGVRYILQKINNRLFPDVAALMRNIQLVTDHLKSKALSRGEAYGGLEIVRTKTGETYCCEDGSYFRVYVFIEGATAHQSATPELFYQSAVAFGSFQNELADLDATLLTEVLPKFHDTQKRFGDFSAVLKADALGRAAGVQREIDFVLAREAYGSRITSLLRSGEMPYRVTHNDTKRNNVMIDDATGKGVAVIDLDTVMPGSCCYDFGDSIRFGCNSAAEDERDLSKVYFMQPLFERYTQGFLSTLKGITPIERENLAFGAILMTYECGMRFLADYLDGDHYFRTHREGHNLDRARTQFKLVAEMESKLDALCDFVRKV